MSLTALVKQYLRDWAGNHHARLEYYRSLPSLEEVIRRATTGVGEDDKMDGHQRRLGYALLERQAKVLLKLKGRIRRAETFEELHDMIWENRLPRVGRLACYDTAVRIGAYLDLEPSVIYLHCGTAAGYRALGLRATGGVAEVSSLPKPPQKLPASDLENFLCIFKDHLAGNGRRNPPSCGPPKRKRRGTC